MEGPTLEKAWCVLKRCGSVADTVWNVYLGIEQAGPSVLMTLSPMKSRLYILSNQKQWLYFKKSEGKQIAYYKDHTGDSSKDELGVGSEKQVRAKTLLGYKLFRQVI